MSDFFDILSIAFVFGFSLAVGFLVKWFYLFLKGFSHPGEKLFKARRHCMEASCVFFSICIACLACILIWTPWNTIVQRFEIEDYAYYFVIFFSMFIFIVFWKALAPIFVGLYVLYCSLFAALFIHSYSALPQNYDITVSENESLEFYAVSLSYKNLLPFSRYWVTVPTAVADGTISETAKHELFAHSIDYFGESSQISSAIRLFSSLILEKDIRLERYNISDFPNQANETELNVTLSVKDSRVVYESY